jgi:hypothetical protein
MKKTIAVAISLLLALSIMVSPVMAQEPPPVDVDTQAEVAGGSVAPVIKAKWELPDDDPVEPGLQKILPPGTWDPATGTQTLGTCPLVVWAVVTDEEGVADILTVQNEVIDSEGTQKWQAVMIEVTDPVVIEAAKVAAVESGQISQAMADDIDMELLKGEALIYCYEGQLDTHQPAGIYTAEVYATDKGGQTSVKVQNNFEVYSTLAFAIDFDLVNWGPIKPLTKDTVSGNEVMEPMLNPPGENPNPPTIKNLGNDPLSLKLHFDPMVGVVQGKEITVFDACFMGVMIDPIPACTWVDWVNDVDPAVSPVKLERCHHTQIDFSVHPPDTVTTDTYKGKLHITVIDP